MASTADIDRMATELLVENEFSKTLFRQSIVTALDQARIVSAVFIAVMFGTETSPVAASMIACEFPMVPLTAGAIELEWMADGRQTSRSSASEGPMVVTERVQPMEMGEEGEGVDVWEMQAAIPHFQLGGLLFSISTSVVPIAQPLRTMAMAMLSTMRWIDQEGSTDGIAAR